MDEVNWRGFELTGVRIDLVQAVQFARAHGAAAWPTDSARISSGRSSRALRLPSSPRTATAMAHQKPGPKKPRSQSRRRAAPARPAATARLTSSASDAEEAVRARRSHSSRPSTNSTPPPSTITSGCQRPLSRGVAEVVEARRARGPSRCVAPFSQASSRLTAGGDAREDQQQARRGSPARGRRPGRSEYGRGRSPSRAARRPCALARAPPAGGRGASLIARA